MLLLCQSKPHPVLSCEGCVLNCLLLWKLELLAEHFEQNFTKTTYGIIGAFGSHIGCADISVLGISYFVFYVSWRVFLSRRGFAFRAVLLRDRSIHDSECIWLVEVLTVAIITGTFMVMSTEALSQDAID